MAWSLLLLAEIHPVHHHNPAGHSPCNLDNLLAGASGPTQRDSLHIDGGSLSANHHHHARFDGSATPASSPPDT